VRPAEDFDGNGRPGFGTVRGDRTGRGWPRGLYGLERIGRDLSGGQSRLCEFQQFAGDAKSHEKGLWTCAVPAGDSGLLLDANGEFDFCVLLRLTFCLLSLALWVLRYKQTKESAMAWILPAGRNRPIVSHDVCFFFHAIGSLPSMTSKTGLVGHEMEQNTLPGNPSGFSEIRHVGLSGEPITIAAKGQRQYQKHKQKQQQRNRAGGGGCLSPLLRPRLQGAGGWH
jgi:hypothetical protein